MLLGRVREPVLTAVRVLVARLDALGGVPVRALPAGHLAEARAARREPVVERRAADASRGLHLPERPVHLVQQPQGLGRPLVEVPAVALEGHEPPDVHLPQVHRRVAVHDPVGDRAPGAAARREAHGVEAGGDEVAAQRRRLAQDVPVVGREALGSVEEQLDAHPSEHGEALRRPQDPRLEMVPVLGQGEELGVLRDPVRRPWLGAGLEEPDHQLARLVAGVGRVVGHAQDRQVRGEPLDRLGDQVEVLRRVERHHDVALAGQLACPHPGAVHDVLARDVAALGGHAADAAVPAEDAGHLRLLEHPGAGHARGLGQRLGHVGGVRHPVARDERGAQDAGGVEERPHLADPLAVDELEVDPDEVAHRRAAPDLLPATGRRRDQQGPVLLEARAVAGAPLELAEQVLRVAREQAHVVRRPELAHQPRGMPGRAGGERLALEQDHVGPAALREVVEHARADDAAADHDDARLGREWRSAGLGRRRLVRHRGFSWRLTGRRVRRAGAGSRGHGRPPAAPSRAAGRRSAPPRGGCPASRSHGPRRRRRGSCRSRGRTRPRS